MVSINAYKPGKSLQYSDFLTPRAIWIESDDLFNSNRVYKETIYNLKFALFFGQTFTFTLFLLTLNTLIGHE